MGENVTYFRNSNDDPVLPTACVAQRQVVFKPWGRTGPGVLGGKDCGGQPVGEIWFEAFGSDILAKYLFTSKRLSIQVHPDDEQARSMGGRRGKDECWLILEAEPGAHYGVGFKRPVTKEELRTAAQDGSIVDLIAWRAAHAGDFIYNPAGTVHALGPGLIVLEVQQKSDITMRLFDYFSDRELHIESALEIARLGEHDGSRDTSINFRSTKILVDGPKFGLAYCTGTIPALGAHVKEIQLITWTTSVCLGRDLFIPPGSCVVLSDSAVAELPVGQEFFLAWSASPTN